MQLLLKTPQIYLNAIRKIILDSDNSSPWVYFNCGENCVEAIKVLMLRPFSPLWEQLCCIYQGHRAALACFCHWMGSPFSSFFPLRPTKASAMDSYLCIQKTLQLSVSGLTESLTSRELYLCCKENSKIHLAVN